MKKCLSVFVLLACFACDDGDSDDGGIIVAPVGGMGEGGQGGVGEGGQGGAGEGGQGGVGQGGQGGAGEGGQGGGGEGGQGGQGGAGEGGMGGEGGEGGEGGGCTPMCDGLTCGPDSCGGECGPGCGDAQVCADGACIAGECPDGTFECGGNCANLLTDANNCGSCGKSCADEWPQEWTDGGFTYAGANIEAICAQAECSFMCAESETGPNQLIEDANNCGACGNVCDSGAVNSLQDACVGAQCFCVLTTNGQEGVLGNACGDRCSLNGVNCGDGCCPEIAAGQTAIPPNDDYLQHSFRLDLDRPRGVEIIPGDDCNNMPMQLVRYNDDGFVQGIAQGRCELLRHPVLAAGHYGVIAGADRQANNSFRLSSAALAPDFDAPATSAPRTATANAVGITFRVAEAGVYRVNFAEFEGGGNCDGAGGVYLLDASGQVIEVLEEENDCSFDLSGRWEGQLAAGIYAVHARLQTLRGPHVVRVDRVDVEPEPDVNPGDGIGAAGTYDFGGFGAGGNEVIELTFAAGGRYTLDTRGPGSNGCPGDTLLEVRLNGQTTTSDDDGGLDRCSQVTQQFDAGVTYEAVVSGYDGIAIGAFSLVVSQ
ncbi:MAG: hypothetical protein ACI9U2_000285 [Bradymonadia bacterium]|jgi:hypothetical protein